MAEPFDDFDALCAVIGFVVINWALAEQSLDFTVETIYNDFAGSTLKKKLPRNFDDKVIFLRGAFQTQVALQIYKDEGNTLLNRMEQLSGQRNDLVHGVVVSVKSIQGGFPIEKLDYGAQEHVMRRLNFDPAASDSLIQELLELGKALPLFGASLKNRRPYLPR